MASPTQLMQQPTAIGGGIPKGGQITLGDDRTPDTIDPTGDAPDPTEGDHPQLSEHLQTRLMELRKQLKEANSSKRLQYIQRVTKAFETFKNNPYATFTGNGTAFDTLDSIFAGALNQSGASDPQMYESNDNVYQMLGMAFIAALSPDVPKTRWQPGDADNEEDVQIAGKASTIQAYNERRNNIKALQKVELLYLWCTGSYFCYTRHIIDKNRAGIRRDPVMANIPTNILPARYVCPNCGTVTPETKVASMGSPQCPRCGARLSEADWYEPYDAQVPQKVGVQEVADGMTAMDVYCGLHVDVDPDAGELYDSLYLDLEVETNKAWVRAQYPGMYTKIQQGGAGTGRGGASADDTARNARQMVTAPGNSTGNNGVNVDAGTYSRCWLQPEAFNNLEDQAEAQQLQKMFPNGVKLVTFSNDLFLQAVPERMMDKWSACRTVKGFGMYPVGVGDSALSIQKRINNCANNIEAYMDRLCFGTILADAEAIDVDAFKSRPMVPGNITGIVRKTNMEGQREPLESYMFQPQFHVDPHIFEYHPQLVQLAQALAGVQPQVFGGSDPNVQTKGGQEQALNTALGRMKLYWDQIREEHASRAQNSVRCSIDNMDDELRIVTGGDDEGGFQTVQILASELVGEAHAYAESDEGFPASYEEIQQRVFQLVQMAGKGSWLNALFSDPDTMKVVASYVLPPGVRMPGDRERARLKTMCEILSKDQPGLARGPDGSMILDPNGAPIPAPSIPLNPKYDDPKMAQTITMNWLQENWRMQQTNPAGFANVLALLTQATELVERAAATQAVQQAAAAAGPGTPQGALPPGQQ